MVRKSLIQYGLLIGAVIILAAFLGFVEKKTVAPVSTPKIGGGEIEYIEKKNTLKTNYINSIKNKTPFLTLGSQGNHQDFFDVLKTELSKGVKLTGEGEFFTRIINNL